MLEKLKINYNQDIYEYNVLVLQNEKIYFVELTDERKIPITIVKDALEEKFNIKINSYAENGHKCYAKDNYVESNEFSYYFSTEDKI